MNRKLFFGEESDVAVARFKVLVSERKVIVVIGREWAAIVAVPDVADLAVGYCFVTTPVLIGSK